MKRKNFKPTVTIGIPAFNEEANIGKLIMALLGQSQQNFRLDRIIIISDGSTDGTNKSVKDFNNKKVELIDYKNRSGLAPRLNRLFKLNKSEIMVKMDADVLPQNKNTIDNLIIEMHDDVSLVGGHRLSANKNTIISSAHSVGDQIWHTSKKKINNGRNIHNHHGTISAMREDLVKLVNIPKGTIGTDDFVYLTVIQNKKKFRFAEKAIVLYKTPDNFHDYIKQHTRFVSAKHSLAQLFGHWIYKEYHVPTINKVVACIKGILMSPLLAFIYIALEIVVRIKSRINPYHKVSYGWDISKSTK